MISPLLDPPEPVAPAFEGRSLPHPDEAVFDQGLAFDVETISRRRVLKALGFGAVSAAWSDQRVDRQA